jgi:hypothetical protein
MCHEIYFPAEHTAESVDLMQDILALVNNVATLDSKRSAATNPTKTARTKIKKSQN